MIRAAGVRRAAGRGEPPRRALALRGLLVVALLAGAVGLAGARSTGGLGGDPQVVALVRDAGGSLRSGADVKIDGVVVGRVVEVRDAEPGAAGEGGADVELVLRIPEDRLATLPADLAARILPATVFGTSFVDLVRTGDRTGDGPVGVLEAGATIPADLGQPTLELQQALDDLDALVDALGPAELAATLGAAAQALDGRGEQIGSLVDRLDAYLEALDPLLPVLRRDVALLGDVLANLRVVAPDLLTAVEDVLVTARTVVERRDDLVAVIDAGTRLAADGTLVLSRNTRTLVRFLDGTAILVDALFDNRVAAIRRAAETNIEVAARVRSIVGEGDFAEVELFSGTEAPPYYGPEDQPRYTRGGSR